VREIRGDVTAVLEAARNEKKIGASLQAAPRLVLPPDDFALLGPAEWAEVCITSGASIEQGAERAVQFHPALGTKCDRCWRVLPEVGASKKHPTLCLRCEDAVEARGAA
jgi:isoleucyl-tRNA synthetase